MRGSYTAGVLSAFEDNDVYFPSIYGISAGACNALSYISGQSYRNHDIFYQYVQGDKYAVSYTHLASVLLAQPNNSA